MTASIPMGNAQCTPRVAMARASYCFGGDPDGFPRERALLENSSGDRPANRIDYSP
jgi:hypothetical protein